MLAALAGVRGHGHIGVQRKALQERGEDALWIVVEELLDLRSQLDRCRHGGRSFSKVPSRRRLGRHSIPAIAVWGVATLMVHDDPALCPASSTRP
jgi:hypothetical protein